MPHHAVMPPFPLQLYILIFSKKVSDFSVSREKNDLGFITFDLKAGILCIDFKLLCYTIQYSFILAVCWRGYIYNCSISDLFNDNMCSSSGQNVLEREVI